MKTIYKIFLYAVLLVTYSCKEEELDLYPKTAVTEGNFYQSEDQFILAVNDVYRQMERAYSPSGIADIYGELSSDNTYIEFIGGSSNSAERITSFNIPTNDLDTENAWQDSYNVIFICNDILDRIDNTNVEFSSQTLKERLKAEITFVRALTYFNMVRVWGDIPLPLTPLSPEEGYKHLREESEVVYDQIISDLVYAKNSLPESYSGSNVGRITKYGATAILAKVYLTRGNGAAAEKALKEVIDSGLYSLDADDNGVVNADDYRYLFHPDTKNSKASILEVQYLGGPNAVNSSHQRAYTPYQWSFHLPGINETYRGGGRNTPTRDLVNEFEPEDTVRRIISVYPGYVNLESGDFVDYPFTMKFYDPNWRYAGQNFEIIRYADVLLMYAEVTNDPAYLNMVRARVGLPAYGEASYPAEYSTLQEAIEHERRVELCFEFHRFFDLVRTGRAVEVMQAKGYDITQDNLHFPIPQRAIDVNPELSQNAGY